MTFDCIEGRPCPKFRRFVADKLRHTGKTNWFGSDEKTWRGNTNPIEPDVFWDKGTTLFTGDCKGNIGFTKITVDDLYTLCSQAKPTEL